jgi:glycosyltransferase involved in cell wall biosynthesis
MAPRRRILYITYDGLADPLGQSQVLPYVRGLSARGYSVDVLSFEKRPTPLLWSSSVGESLRLFALRYHKSPPIPATAFDIAHGLGHTAWLSLVNGYHLIHVRSYVAALIASSFSQMRRIPWLFDMRGMWVDERVAAGSWSSGSPSYRFAKVIERRLIATATTITVLTNAMRRQLRREFRDELACPVHVIPTCVDTALFRPDVDPDSAIASLTTGRRVLVYVGSLGGRYLPDVMARFYLAWRKLSTRGSRFMVVSNEQPRTVAAMLRAAGVEPELIHVRAARERIPALLRCATAGVFMYRKDVSTCGTAPTKLGEMLACGLPVAGNAVGDVAAVLGDGTGVVVRDASDAALGDAAFQLFGLENRQSTPQRARRAALRWFELGAGVDAYASLYEALAERTRPIENVWPPLLTAPLLAIR